ncbi:MAG: transposase [Clostridia bacterium]|nr:transposase [Clostridia bacterium]
MEYCNDMDNEGYITGVELSVTKEDLGELLYNSSSGFFGVGHAEKILMLVERDGDTSTKFQETRDFIVSHCIKELKHCTKEMDVIEREIKSLMKKFPYKLETMPGIETITAAAIVSEIGDIRRFASANKLLRYSGISPVSCSSGDKDKNFRNRQGNRRLYEIFRNIAARSICKGRNNQSPVNDAFLSYYNKKITQGKTRRQALIAVMSQIAKIVYSMMRDERAYVKPTISKTNNT